MALHEVQLKGYSVRPGNLSLGTFGSYGIEQLHVTLDDTWSGLAVTATQRMSRFKIRCTRRKINETLKR